MNLSHHERERERTDQTTPNGCVDRDHPLQVENSPSSSNNTTIKTVVDIHLNRLAVGKSCSESPIILQLKSDLSTTNTTNMYRVLKSSNPIMCRMTN